MENPREGKSWYSAEFVGESTEPKNVFVDLIVKDRVESGFYGKQYKLTLGNRDFGFWRDRLNQLYTFIMDLN